MLLDEDIFIIVRNVTGWEIPIKYIPKLYTNIFIIFLCEGAWACMRDMRVYVVLQVTKVKKTTKTLETFEFSLHIHIDGLVQDYSNCSAVRYCSLALSHRHVFTSHDTITHLHSVFIFRVTSYKICCRIFYSKRYIAIECNFYVRRYFNVMWFNVSDLISNFASIFCCH